MPRDPDDELDLPALDGESEDEEMDAAHEDLEVADDGGDALDDATAGDTVDDGFTLGEGPEGGLLTDADDAATLDVGTFDLSIGSEEGDLLDDEAEGRGTDEDLAIGEETTVADGGEEGPLGGDEELREEDLPALDADEDGDVADDELYDRGLISDQDELRWDDRAWAKLDEPVDVAEDADDSGTLASPGEDAAHRARDAAWKRLDETGRLMAATVLPGGSVIVALATADWGRAQLVRILLDGSARIIAEVDRREDDAADDDCKVTFLRWEAAANRLVVGGTFGICAFRPA